MITVRIQAEDFDAALEKKLLQKISLQAGAVLEFTGCVRALEDDATEELTAIYLEHYPVMTEKSMQEIVAQAMQRWSIIGITIIHRIGTLSVGENIVYVGVASLHRKEALQCIDFIMDYLKNEVPIWKKEVTDTKANWVEQKQSDIKAKSAWKV